MKMAATKYLGERKNFAIFPFFTCSQYKPQLHGLHFLLPPLRNTTSRKYRSCSLDFGWHFMQNSFERTFTFQWFITKVLGISESTRFEILPDKDLPLPVTVALFPVGGGALETYCSEIRNRTEQTLCSCGRYFMVIIGERERGKGLLALLSVWGMDISVWEGNIRSSGYPNNNWAPDSYSKLGGNSPKSCCNRGSPGGKAGVKKWRWSVETKA